MKREHRLLILGTVAVATLGTLVVFLVTEARLRRVALPESFEARLAWVIDHPADWRAASLVSDGALDSDLETRKRVWIETFALAQRVAPLRRNPRVGFVRAGLFHWYELDRAERKKVLEVVTPLMKEPAFFSQMHGAFWRVTRDLRWLRAVAPDSVAARELLRAIAIRHGEFEHYRQLRADLRRERIEQLAAVPRDAQIDVILALLPERLDLGDEGLIRAVLQELDVRPFNPDRLGASIQDLVEIATRHDLQPMTGLRALIETPGKVADEVRARAAIDLGDLPLATRIEISTAVPGDERWITYYVERARIEAAAGNAANAEGYLARAALTEMTIDVLAAAADIAAATGNPARAAEARQRLRAEANRRPHWVGTCGEAELCATAVTRLVTTGAAEPVHLPMSTVQSDETPPYVEIYVDDRLEAEGEVTGTPFVVRPADAGVHRIEVRLVNRTTKNGVQRRVRLS